MRVENGERVSLENHDYTTSAGERSIYCNRLFIILVYAKLTYTYTNTHEMHHVSHLFQKSITH